MSISVAGIHKRYGDHVALDGVDLDVATGKLVALLGPSGCGKTTLLRIIAGLETPDAGRVLLHGVDATDWPVQARRVGFVFQHYALFRHMTVRDNVAFGLDVRRRRERPARAAIDAKVDELLALVQLEWAGHRLPAQLSGGQRQRVALARALAIEPEVLLLDEPFGALDTQVRQELRRWLRRLHDALHFTSVFVTHDQQEALEVADTLIVLNGGRVEQQGTPREVYDRPASAFVHRFVGICQQLPARRHAGAVFIGPLTVTREGGPDAELAALVRPHDIEVRRGGAGWTATVTDLRVIGSLVRLELQAEGLEEPLLVEAARDDYDRDAFAVGDSVSLGVRRWSLYPSEAAE